MGAAMAQQAFAASAPAAASNDEPPPIPSVGWYYVVGGERRGPTDVAGLRQAATGGAFGPATLVWKKGMPEWMAAQKVDDLRELLKV
jgi:uncharacterized protein DUF4339